MSQGGIVAAVDFGTTRSAFAITRQGSIDYDIEVDVPAGASAMGGAYDTKTPSSILLDKAGEKVLAYGYGAEARYSNARQDDDLFFRWFKMGLHNSSSQDPVINAMNGTPLKLSEVLAKALEYLKEDVMKKLSDRGEFVQATALIWVITVPAIWNDWALEMMRGAAYRAGMMSELRSPRLKLALEPECACISIQMERGAAMEVGDKLITLDCGGGTVDITAHQVRSVNPLRLKGLMAPDGGFFGGIRVDEKFYHFFKSLVGSERFQALMKSTAYFNLARAWEARKTTFTGEENSDPDWHAELGIGEVAIHLHIHKEMADLVSRWNTSNPHKPARLMGMSTLGLSFNLMISFFEDPINRIVGKLNGILSSPANSTTLSGLRWVVIAGGFGRSPVLQQKVRENFQHSAVTVVVCRHPDLAIVKGAAAYGARSDVFESRKAKYTVGIGASMIFRALDPLHAEHESKKYMGLDGKWRLNVFDIYGRVGDDVKVGSRSKRAVYKSAEGQTTITFRILVTKSPEVFLQDGPDVRTLGSWTVMVDTSVPLQNRRHKVEFKLGEAETTCICYKETDEGDIQVHEMEVDFPSDIHWTFPLDQQDEWSEETEALEEPNGRQRSARKRIKPRCSIM